MNIEERRKEYEKKYREKNKQKMKLYHRENLLERHYRMSIKDYSSMLKEQDYKCGICLKELDKNKSHHIDHCHFSGKIRGILCAGCNIGLGMFKDNLESLKKAISYLERT